MHLVSLHEHRTQLWRMNQIYHKHSFGAVIDGASGGKRRSHAMLHASSPLIFCRYGHCSVSTADANDSSSISQICSRYSHVDSTSFGSSIPFFIKQPLPWQCSAEFRLALIGGDSLHRKQGCRFHHAAQFQTNRFSWAGFGQTRLGQFHAQQLKATGRLTCLKPATANLKRKQSRLCASEHRRDVWFRTMGSCVGLFCCLRRLGVST